MSQRNMIKDGQVVENDYLLVTELADNAALPEGNIIVSTALWSAHREALISRATLGLWLRNDEDVSAIANELDHFAVIAIDFPVFMDGRGFSLGRLVRERYGFTGELRASGGIIRDQLCYLKRCGFNAFDLTEDVDLEKAIASLNDFTEAYQTGVDQKSPLFRRRA